MHLFSCSVESRTTVCVSKKVQCIGYDPPQLLYCLHLALARYCVFTSTCVQVAERERGRMRFGRVLLLASRSLVFFRILFQVVQAEQQWNPVASDEEDTRPWHFQRRAWRSHSRKRQRYERDCLKWRCLPFSGRDWKGWICTACGWGWKPPRKPLRNCRLGTRQEPQDAIMQKSNSCQMEQTRKVEDPAVPIEETALV